MSFPPLDAVQRWMQEAVRNPLNPGPMRGDWDADALITASQRQSAADRMAVYAHAYFARLLECLQSEFPAVRRAAGDEGFSALACGYLQARPSTSYTLHRLGAGFADFLAATRPERQTDEPDFPDFLIELANLERTYAEICDAAGPEDVPSLSADELRNLSPERFANAQVVFHETVRLMAMRFPCQEFASAVRAGVEAFPPEPRETCLLIFRRDYVVRRTPISLPQYELLSQLLVGRTIGSAIEARASQASHPGDLSDEIRRWFAEWSALRLFRGIA
jgi:hypothetical protein